MKTVKTFAQRFGRLALAASALVLAASSMSAAGYKSLVLSKTDGTNVTLNFSDKLETTVSGENLVFADNGTEVISVPVAQLAGWNFSAGTTTAAINRLAGDNNFSMAGGIVSIDGLADGTEVCVVAASGATVMRAVAAGSCTLDLSGLANGVYVITYNNQTVKIAVR